MIFFPTISVTPHMIAFAYHFLAFFKISSFLYLLKQELPFLPFCILDSICPSCNSCSRGWVIPFITNAIYSRRCRFHGSRRRWRCISDHRRCWWWILRSHYQSQESVCEFHEQFWSRGVHACLRRHPLPLLPKQLVNTATAWPLTWWATSLLLLLLLVLV